MFKNRAIQVKMVKTDDSNETVADTSIVAVDPEQIAKIATEFALKTIGAVGVVIAGNKILTTICDIATLATKAKLK